MLLCLCGHIGRLFRSFRGFSLQGSVEDSFSDDATLLPTNTSPSSAMAHSNFLFGIVIEISQNTGYFLSDLLMV
jgi:hypothetical protein